MIYIGIDPGLDGAVAFLCPDGRVEFYDTPTVLLGEKRDYDLKEMRDILERCNDLDACVKPVLCGLEYARPGVFSNGLWIL